MRWLVRKLIELGRRTPYFHLFTDGSPYMERFWLMPRWLLSEQVDLETDGAELKPKKWLPLAFRLHHIQRADLDRDMHNHPSPFISIVLSGGYTERRPVGVDAIWRYVRERDFDSYVKREYWQEVGVTSFRLPGSIAFRRPSDRHLITSVLPDTWTLVIWFRKRAEWGYMTHRGFVPWKKYRHADV